MNEAQIVAIVLSSLQRRREAWEQKRALSWGLTTPSDTTAK